MKPSWDRGHAKASGRGAKRKRRWERDKLEMAQPPAFPDQRRPSSAPISASVDPNREVIYGRRPVFEAFQAGKRTFHKLWVVKGAEGGIVEDIVRLARERGVPMEWTRPDTLDRMAHGHHQGVALQASAAQFLELADFLSALDPTQPVLVVALDEIQDPQNMGAILRNAGFFGVSAAIVPKWRSAPVGETAARASSGAIEHVPLIRVGNLVESMHLLQEQGFEILGADAEGDPLWQHAKAQKSVLVLGSEGHGLRRLVKERCDKLIAIPRRTAVDSLNVASAAAIFLYEFFRGQA